MLHLPEKTSSLTLPQILAEYEKRKANAVLSLIPVIDTENYSSLFSSV
jgi:hypothetical protein